MNEFNALIAAIPTKRELNLFLSALESSERGLFRVSADIEKFFSEQFPDRVALALTGYAASKKVNLNDPTVATEFLKELRGELQKAPIVTLHIAFEPTRGQIDKISAWFAQGSSHGVIFDFRYDPTVIAGAVVEYGGKIGDFTVEKKVNDYLHP